MTLIYSLLYQKKIGREYYLILLTHRQLFEQVRDNKRGRKGDSSAKEMARLKRENERLRRELEKAQLIMDAQKKLSQVLGLTLLDSQEKSEEQ